MTWHFHDWMATKPEERVELLRGPYDPRSEKQRTFRIQMEICSKCGKTRPTPEYGYCD